jgi:transposase
MDDAVLEWMPRRVATATESLVERLLVEVGALRQELAEVRQEVVTLRVENAHLRQQVGYYKSMHERAVARLVEKDAEIEQLKGRVRQLESERFGRQSEKAAASDRSNTLPGEEDPPPGATCAAAPKRSRGQQPDRPGPKRRGREHLPVVEEFVELTDAQGTCPRCGERLAANGTEDSEQIEIEVRAYRRCIRRRRGQRKCSCRGPRTVVAPSPPKLIPKGALGTSVWVELLLGKFLYHQPIERQLAAWQRRDLDLSPGTIADGLQRLEPMFTPLYEGLLARAAAAGFAQADETRWLVFIEQVGKTGHRWWLWAFLTDEVAAFRLDPTRSHDVPEKHFASRGCPSDSPLVLLVDRYSAYKAMESVHEGQIVLAFCWAHVRRDFVRVGKGWTELLPWALAWLQRIRHLYHCQRQRLSHAADSVEFAAAEAGLSACLAQMHDQAVQELADRKLREPCRKALTSLQEHWPGLTRFVDDLRIPLDNNAAERVQRGPAVGRKNYYGSGSLWSGRLAAMMFSLLATLKLHGLNERKWLTWFLHSCAAAGGRSPADIQPFLPWNLTLQQRAKLALDPNNTA